MRKTLFILFLCLTGCATHQVAQQPTLPQTTSSETWGNRVEALSSVQHWDLDAMIGIRNMAKQDSNSASMQWKQSKLNYSILLFGPLGSSSTKLTGRPGGVTLEMANGQTFHAKSPELLVTEQTGWRLPVSNLYYWIRGLPVPSLPADKKLDPLNHLIELSQAGWRIQYLDYKNVHQIDLPTKILLDNSDLNVKIIIRQWQF